MARKRKCPVDGCDTKIPGYHRLCKMHFAMLPRELKNKITGEKWWNHTLEAVQWLNKNKDNPPEEPPLKKQWWQEN